MLRCLATASLVGCLCTSAQAAITWSGNVDPADPSTWTTVTRAFVGRTSDGTLIVDGGSELESAMSDIGSEHGSNGTAIVEGVGSRWTSSALYVGRHGTATLAVNDGGSVETGALYASVSDLYGDGTITTMDGAILDADLVFDETPSTHMIVPFGDGGKLIVNLGVREFGLGYKQSGCLTVANGATLSVHESILGYGVGSTGAATVTGAGSEWTGGGSMLIGYRGAATLMVEAGAEVRNLNAVLGFYADSSGSATVTGAGSRWTNDTLWLGREGTGALTVANGGEVVARHLNASVRHLYGDGTITVTHGGFFDADLVFDVAHPTQAIVPFGSNGSLHVSVRELLGIGYRETGSLRVTDGVRISSSIARIGVEPGSTGFASVTGAGSQWDNTGDLRIGNFGNGRLLVEAGAQVSNGRCTIASEFASKGSATIRGSGSHWNNTSSLVVGRRGAATLSIEAGGRVTSQSGLIGENTASTAAVSITGTGSAWNNYNELGVGTGTLSIEAGGAATSYLGILYGRAVIHGPGSHWTIERDLYVRENAKIIVAAGGMLANFNGEVSRYQPAVPPGVDILINGAGSTWKNNGRLQLGSGATTLAITDEALVIVADALWSGGDAVINMATGAMLALAGEADDSLTQFLDLVQGTDAIRYWDSGASTWAHISGAAYGEDYTLEYLTAGDLSGYTLLTVNTPGPPSDFDSDLDVDGADFLAWQRGGGMELADWQANYGMGSASSAVSAVPEPSGVMLMALTLGLGDCARHSRRRVQA